MINLSEFFNQRAFNYQIISDNNSDNYYLSSVSLGIENFMSIKGAADMHFKTHACVMEISELAKLNPDISAIPSKILLLTKISEETAAKEINSFTMQYPDCIIVLIITKISAKDLYLQIAAAIAEECSSTHELLFTHYINLVHLLTQEGDIGEIETYAYKILDNPMIITDASYKIIAYSHAKEISDPIWATIVNNDYCPSPIVEMTDFNNFWNRLHCAGRPLFVDSEHFSPYVRRAVSEITVYGKVKGYIALLEINKTITVNDLSILQMITELVGVKLAEENAVSKAVGQLEREFIRDLFLGATSSENMARNRAQSMRLDLKKWFAVLCIETKGENIYIETKLDKIANKLTMHFPLCLYNTSGNHGFFLLSFDDKRQWYYLLHHEIEKIIIEEHLICSAGLPVDLMTKIHESYDQAKKASEILPFLSEDMKKKPLYLCSEVAVYDLLLQFSKNAVASNVANFTLQQIQELDTEGGSEYLLTLQRFFENNQNIAATANSMYIHRNTVIYRLNRLRKLLVDDFDSPLVRLNLYIAILIRDIETKKI